MNYRGQCDPDPFKVRFRNHLTYLLTNLMRFAETLNNSIATNLISVLSFRTKGYLGILYINVSPKTPRI